MRAVATVGSRKRLRLQALGSEALESTQRQTPTPSLELAWKVFSSSHLPILAIILCSIPLESVRRAAEPERAGRTYVGKGCGFGGSRRRYIGLWLFWKLCEARRPET